jgi:hypothetical protein
MKKPTVILLSALTSALLIASAQAQQCKVSSITPSNNSQQFVINHQAGTVIDARTGLEWSLCSTGQIWQNGNCTGAPTHFATYAEALTGVDGNSLGANFRLPNIKELGSIIERSCSTPAIDLTIFNGTLNAVYYSSTPDNQGNQHFSPELGVKIIDFTNGTEFVPDVSKFRYVRLVRSIN